MAAAPDSQPLIWEPPYAMVAALKIQKKKKKKKNTKNTFFFTFINIMKKIVIKKEMIRDKLQPTTQKHEGPMGQ